MIRAVLSLGAIDFLNLNVHSVYQSYRLVQILFLKDIRLRID